MVRHQRGDEVFPVVGVVFIAKPEDLVGKVFQQRPHLAILNGGAPRLFDVENQRALSVDRQLTNEVDGVLFNAFADEVELLAHASPPKRVSDRYDKTLTSDNVRRLCLC